MQGDARNLDAIPAGSVDLVVTSPPYWQLRAYTDGGRAYGGQIGGEPDIDSYVAALLAVLAECARVVKPSGSIFVNLGDKHATRWASRSEGGGFHAGRGRDDRGGKNTTGLPEKSLLGLPWRFALAACDQLGLVLRQEIIWSKRSGLPESVKDRCQRSHEQLFHFTRRRRYYSAVDVLRVPHAASTIARCAPHRSESGAARKAAGDAVYSDPSWRGQHMRLDQSMHELGRAPRSVWELDGGESAAAVILRAVAAGELPPETALGMLAPPPPEGDAGDVWEIAGQPLTLPPSLGVEHFAAFPMELPRRCIRGWSPPGVCTECGQGRRAVVSRDGVTGGDNNPDSRNGTRRKSGMDGGRAEWARRLEHPDRLAGWACGCDTPSAPTRRAVVLDPFGGTGTTALVADAEGRDAIYVDASADYCRAAAWRTTDRRERARALQVPVPDPEPDGMDALF